MHTGTISVTAARHRRYGNDGAFIMAYRQQEDNGISAARRHAD